MAPQSRYGFAWNPGKNTPARYGLFVLQAAIAVVLSYLGVVFSPVSFVGVGLFYWAEAFIMLFTLWWGIWGVAGTYIGTFIGAGVLTGISTPTALLFGLSDTVAVIISFMIYRAYASKHNISPFGADILHKPRALGLFILWIVVITNVIGAFIGVTILQIAGLITASNYLPALGIWIIGDAIMLLVFMPVTSKFVTPVLAKHGLVTEGWFS